MIGHLSFSDWSYAPWALVIALALALVDWLAVARRQKWLEYVFKPATLIAILIGAWMLTRGPHDAWEARFYRSIFSGLRRQGQTALRVPVALYSLVLSLMLSSAWATLFRPEWTPLRQGLVIAGASLFFASDAMLAWDRFVTPSSRLHLLVIVTYHLGQIGLAASIALW
jgi:uncharacterized membrane protein YhhN